MQIKWRLKIVIVCCLLPSIVLYPPIVCIVFGNGLHKMVLQCGHIVQLCRCMNVGSNRFRHPKCYSSIWIRRCYLRVNLQAIPIKGANVMWVPTGSVYHKINLLVWWLAMVCTWNACKGLTKWWFVWFITATWGNVKILDFAWMCDYAGCSWSSMVDQRSKNKCKDFRQRHYSATCYFGSHQHRCILQCWGRKMWFHVRILSSHVPSIDIWQYWMEWWRRWHFVPYERSCLWNSIYHTYEKFCQDGHSITHWILASVCGVWYRGERSYEGYCWSFGSCFYFVGREWSRCHSFANASKIYGGLTTDFSTGGSSKCFDDACRNFSQVSRDQWFHCGVNSPRSDGSETSFWHGD